MSELIDNRAKRVRTLKGILKRLHAGEAQDEVRARLKELVCQTDYSEVIAMGQELIADGMPVEEIQCMCDLHSQGRRCSEYDRRSSAEAGFARVGAPRQ